MAWFSFSVLGFTFKILQILGLPSKMKKIFGVKVENLREFLSPCGPWPIVDNNSLKKQSWSKPAKPKEKNTKGRPKPGFCVASNRIVREMRTQIGAKSPPKDKKQARSAQKQAREAKDKHRRTTEGPERSREEAKQRKTQKGNNPKNEENIVFRQIVA